MVYKQIYKKDGELILSISKWIKEREKYAIRKFCVIVMVHSFVNRLCLIYIQSIDIYLLVRESKTTTSFHLPVNESNNNGLNGYSKLKFVLYLYFLKEFI